MKHVRIFVTLLAFALIHVHAFAKRLPPEKVPPVMSDGVKYLAPHVTLDYQSTYGLPSCPIGCIEARDAKSDKLLWQVLVYKIVYDSTLESDVQDVFIRSLEIKDGYLLVENELGEKFSVDLKNRKIKRFVVGLLDDLRSQWVGQYPHKGETFFLNEPRIKDHLQKMLGQDRFESLAAGEYLEIPIDYVEGCYILSFGANPHRIREEEWVYIIIREYTGSVHTAIKDANNHIQWKHSAESEMPVRILKMLDLYILR
jgi:hypothetical protein